MLLMLSVRRRRLAAAYALSCSGMGGEVHLMLVLRMVLHPSFLLCLGVRMRFLLLQQLLAL